MTFNPKGLYVTVAFVALMLPAIAGNPIAIAVALIAEGVAYFAIFGGFGRTRPIR